jgi:hypothetical protein
MTIHIELLQALIKAKFNITEFNDDDEEENPKPFFHSHTGPKPCILGAIATKMATRPGSVLLASTGFTESFSQIITGKRNLRILFLLTVPRGDFKGKVGELLKNMPYYSTKAFSLFCFDCDNAVTDALVEELGVKHNVSVLDVHRYRHLHALQAKHKNGDMREISKLRKKKRKKRAKRGGEQ